MYSGNYALILAALNKYRRACEYASETMRGDRARVLAAVNQYGMALGYAIKDVIVDG